MERMLRRCDESELTGIGDGMGIKAEIEGKSKREMLRTIQVKIDDTDEGAKNELLTTMGSYLPERYKNKFNNLMKETLLPGQEEMTHHDTSLLDVNATDLIAKLKGILLEAQQPPKRDPAMDETLASMLSTAASGRTGNNMFRREFKIQGTVGAPNAKEALNYISLVSQIGEGKTRGYSDSEIAMAVRKAVSTGTPMRTYLDSNTEMSLVEVVSFVRTYLKEKPASELFSTLTNLAQKPEEDAQTFVLRGLELREKVIKSSAAEGSIRFDSDVVYDAFRHTVKTGLANDQIRMRIEPLLCNPAMKDGELLQAINIAMSEEVEKLSKRNKTAKVHAVGASTEYHIRELSNQVGQMQQEMSKWKINQGSQGKTQSQESKNNTGWQNDIGNYHGEVMDGRYQPSSTQRDSGYRRNSTQRDGGHQWNSTQDSKNNTGWQHKIGNYHGNVMDGRYQTSSTQRNSTQRDGGYQRNTTQQDGKMPHQSQNQSAACSKCLPSNSDCRHCFKCEEEGHMARNCPLNGNRLPAGGRR